MHAAKRRESAQQVEDIREAMRRDRADFERRAAAIEADASSCIAAVEHQAADAAAAAAAASSLDNLRDVF